MTSRSLAALLAVATALGAAARADDPVDSVDLEVGPRVRVTGTLRPAAERESFLVRALRGTKVKATVRTSGKGGPVPALELVDGALAPVAAGRGTRSGASISKLAIASTADHRFRVTGDGTDGDYRFDLTLTPRTKWKASSEADLGPGEETTFAFAAPEGAAATIDLRAARGSGVAPLLLDVTSPLGGVVALDPAGATPSRHRATVAVADAGEQVVRLRNAGDAAGAWTLTVRVVVPKASRATTDLRDDALGGEFDGARAVVGRIADDDHATAFDVPDGLGLDGASISVPSGAVSLPTLVTMTSSDSFFVGDDEHPAGPTVVFEPSGAVFDPPAHVTLPFDPDAFDDPADELSIVVEGADGTLETIAADSIDAAGATATFPVSHFSRFQTVSPRPRPLRGAFAELQLTGRALPGYGAEVTLGRNSVVIGKGARVAGPGVRTVRRTSIGWFLDLDGAPLLRVSSDVRPATAVVAEVADDDSVLIRHPGDDVLLDRGRGSDALSAAAVDADSVGIHAVLRIAPGAPTRANLRGRWHAAVFELSAARAPAAGVDVVVAAQELEIDVGLDGRATASSAALVTSSQRFPRSRWVHGKNERRPHAGRLDPGAAGAHEVVLRMPLGVSHAIDEVRLVPVLRGDALVGGADAVVGDASSPDAAAVRLVLLVRRRAGSEAPTLSADSILTSLVVTAEDTPAPPAPLRFGVRRGHLSVGAGGAANLSGLASLVGHDLQGAAASTVLAVDDSGTASVRADGRVEGGGAIGGGYVGPRNSVLVVFSRGAGTLQVGLGLPARPGAAAK